MKHAKFVSFTEVGARTAARAAALLPDFLTERYARTVDPSLSGTSLSRFAQQAMVDCDLIVFVGAAGIAVRAVAPYLAGKAYDPAVIVIDEAGKFVIPLLSGHLGGANALAERLADGLGAQAVVTTATDGRDVFAVDNWARDNGCAVFDPPHIKYVSGALLRGETVGVRSDFPVDGRLPAHISLNADAESGFVIGFDTKVVPFAHTLHLVPRIVYDNLIKSVHGGLKYLHGYMGWRAEKMGLAKLHMYDLHVPVVSEYKLSVSYEEACEIVKKALAPLGEEYLSHIREAMENRWIDVYENKGKRTGAYSWGTYRSHPYVLLNYNGTAHDVFTIAHELGHSMHSYYSDKNQPSSKAQYEIFVAEVASTVNEVLLLKYMLEHSRDEQEREYLLTYYLDMFRTTLFRQTQFAEFEEKAHALAEKDMPVTCDALNEEYLKINKLYYGKNVVSDKQIAWEWARIPHFYRSFYVYKYATGLTSAVSIARGILSGGEKEKEGYMKFLSAGGSMPPVEILKLAGVDLTTEVPFENAMREMADTLGLLKREK